MLLPLTYLAYKADADFPSFPTSLWKLETWPSKQIIYDGEISLVKLAWLDAKQSFLSRSKLTTASHCCENLLRPF